MNQILRTEDEIRAAGREAVAGWRLSEKQVDFVVALITPVYSDVWCLLDANQRPAQSKDKAA